MLNSTLRAFVLAVLCLPGILSAQVLIDEDFSNGFPSDWVHYDGFLSVTDGIMTLGWGCVILPGTYSREHNLRIEADVTFEGATFDDFNIFAFYDLFDPPAPHCFFLTSRGYSADSYPQGSDNKLDLMHSHDGNTIRRRVERPTTLAAGVTHRIAAEFRNDGKIALFHNGLEVLSFNDTTHQSGPIVLRTWQNVEIDNVLVIEGQAVGLDEILFDDFNYDCIGDCPGECTEDCSEGCSGERALFKHNSWYKTDEEFSQCFWNSDGATGEREMLDSNGLGYLALRLPEGFATINAKNLMTPKVASPIQFNGGTYVARVAFDGGTPVDNVVQPFWVQSGASCDPLYAEVDFEFYSKTFLMDYVVWETGGDGCEVRTSDPFEDFLVTGNWVDLVMRVKPDQSVSFDAYDSTTGQQLVSGWELIENEHLPEAASRMGIFFNVWLVELPALSRQHEFLVDWVVHLPHETQVSWADVSALVKSLRAASIERKDTTDSPF